MSSTSPVDAARPYGDIFVYSRKQNSQPKVLAQKIPVKKEDRNKAEAKVKKNSAGKNPSNGARYSG